MATTKVGVYRKYRGPVPEDPEGKPLSEKDWPRKRRFSWAVRWFGENGRRYSKSFKSRKEATRFAEGKQNDVRRAAADPPKSLSLEEFAGEHGDVMKGQVAQATLEDQARALRMFKEHVGGNTALSKVKPHHAESYVASRLRSGASVATVNKDIRTLKRVFNLAIEPRGYLLEGQNPFRSVKQRKQADKPLRYVTHEEFEQVRAATESLWWHSLLTLLYTTALRLGEALNLTWADVDFEHDRVRVAAKDQSECLLAWEPKDHESRILPAPPAAIQLLTDLQVEAAEGCPYVFVPAWRWDFVRRALEQDTWRDGQRLVNNLGRRLATVRKRAKVAHFTFHDLRRTCVTNWARTLPAHVTQRLAGHSDIKTTLKYYISVQPEDLERARTVQAAILRGGLTDPKVTHSGQKS